MTGGIEPIQGADETGHTERAEILERHREPVSAAKLARDVAYQRQSFLNSPVSFDRRVERRHNGQRKLGDSDGGVVLHGCRHRNECASPTGGDPRANRGLAD